MKDIREFHSAFYAHTNKAAQDAFILKYCRSSPPKRRRSRTNTRPNKGMTVEYNIVNQVGNCLPVCRQTFLSTLGITKHRVIGVFQRFKRNGGHVPVETRGGDRRSKAFERKSNSVKDFIQTFEAVESHYCRGKSERVYLDSSLNIKKMWRMYNQKVHGDLKVKESYFRHIFSTLFNISFKAPSTDVCSKCTELTGRIRTEADVKKKNELMIELRVHKLRYRAFYDMLKDEKEGMLIISFDCQKNLVLPKVADQAAYYSRQLYCYNFTVVTGSSRSQMSNENVSIYTWCENDRPKSSNEIASAVYNALQTANLQGIDTVRLMADGCAGQNKNLTLLTMVSKWLLHAPANVKSVQIVFPVVGHSFLPSDRVFGRIEKEVKRKETIIEPKEYHNIFEHHGSLKPLGTNWDAYDWKKEASDIVKATSSLHFKISQCKRFHLRRSVKTNNILVRGEPHYRTDIGIERSITKKNKTFAVANPQKLPIGIPVKKEKVNDVSNLLLKHFGCEWKSLDTLLWYKRIVESSGDNDELVEELPCECIQEDVSFL